MDQILRYYRSYRQNILHESSLSYRTRRRRAYFSAYPRLLAHSLLRSSTSLRSTQFCSNSILCVAFILLTSLESSLSPIPRAVLWRGVRASETIYCSLIEKILGARSKVVEIRRDLHFSLTKSLSTVRFFDSTPSGRILNRLSKDIETIDQDFSRNGGFFLTHFFAVIAIIITISYSLPAFLPAAAVISSMYW